MIAQLKGIIDKIGDTWVILDVQGVGYQVSCSARTLGQLGEVGEAACLQIETVLRQDSLQLYGFGSQSEKDMFMLLTTVQGVGMRVGLAILSALSANEIIQAIASQDKTAITRADGVGPKLAGRLVAELKDKVPQMGPVASPQLKVISTETKPQLDEAISALVNLGYRRPEAVQAITLATKDLGEDAPLNDMIRVGLSHLARSA